MIPSDLNPTAKLDKGIVNYDVPTGEGKSYAATKFIYEESKKRDKKYFYITNMIKNLSTDDLYNCYKEDGRSEHFDNEVLQVKSNLDFVLDNIEKVSIPDKNTQAEAYEVLKSTIQNYRESNGLMRSHYEKNLREVLEPQFRNYIKNEIIRKKIPKSNQRKQLIKEREEFQWIGKLYPTVFIEDYKIYVLSMAKFLTYCDPLISSSFQLLQSKLTNDSVIIMDEFDATKEVFISNIIKNSIRAKVDYLELFRTIYQRMEAGNQLNWLEELDNTNGKSDYKDTKEEAEKINQDFYLSYRYKSINLVPNTRNYLFHDGQYYTSYYNKNYFIHAQMNEVLARVDIEFSKENTKDHKMNDVNPLTMVTTIFRFLERLKRRITFWAFELVEERKLEQQKMNHEETMTVENAVASIFDSFGFSPEQRKLLRLDFSRSDAIKSTTYDHYKNVNFYEEGFQWYEFIDSNDHVHETKIRVIQMNELPERALVQLCNRALVIGLSATASIPTVIGNYDLDYLKRELGENYFEGWDFLTAETKSNLQNKSLAYQKAGVSVRIKTSFESIEQDSSEWKLLHLLGESTIESCYAPYKRLYAQLQNTIFQLPEDKRSFFENRYLELFESFSEFLSDKEKDSYLGIVSPFSKKDYPEFDQKLIQTFFDEISCWYGTKAHLITLKGDNFDFTKNSIINKLESGEKVYVLSTYKTIGAGQNLQYSPPKNRSLLYLFDKVTGDPRFEKKDFDGLYLGDTSYLLNYLPNKVDDYEQLFQWLIQIEYLYQNGEIPLSTHKYEIRKAMNKFSGNYDTQNGLDGNLGSTDSKLGSAPSVCLKSTLLVIQAIGRVTRTFVKSSNLLIMLSPTLMNRITKEKVNERSLSYEVQELFAYRGRESYGAINFELSEHRRQQAIIANSQNYINTLLERLNSDTRSIGKWKNLREQVVSFPTSRDGNDEFIKTFYLELSDTSRYFYSKKDEDYFISKKRDDLKSYKQPIHEVSAEDARLTYILNYPGMSEHFKYRGFATSFDAGDCMINPIFYQSIMKGYYGELAGQFIFEKETGLKLKDIEETEYFELFDFHYENQVFFDFKNWSNQTEKDAWAEQVKVREKLAKLNGKLAVIANIVQHSESHEIKIASDKLVVEVPWLIDRKGELAKDYIIKVKEIIDDLFKHN